MTRRSERLSVAVAVLLASCADGTSPGLGPAVPGDGATAEPALPAAACPQGVSTPGTVYGRGLRAVVTPAPFRLQFIDDAGQTVLSEVDNPSLPPFVAVDAPNPAGADTVPARSLYAPITFEVGGATNPQFPGTPWAGNILLGGSGGVQYAATSVIASQCSGTIARMTLATNDPTGRTILLTIKPDVSGARAMQVSAVLSDTTGVDAIADSFSSGPDEQFYGFGGLHNALSQRGNTVTTYTQEENFGASALSPLVAPMPGTGGTGYLFPNGPTAAYYPQALFVSSRSYAFELESTGLSRFRLAYADDKTWQVETDGSTLDYVVVAGPARDALKELATINGRQRVPPDWGLGPTLDHGVRVLSSQADTADTYYAGVLDDIAKMDTYDIRPTSYRVEGWDFISRDRLADIVGKLRARGIRPMFYIRPFASRDVANTENAQVFQDAVTNGYCTTLAPGACYIFGSTFIVGVAVLTDFTQPAAVKWWNGRIDQLLDLGADGFMEDFGEQTLTDMQFANGSNGRFMHNPYPVLYHATTRAELDAYQKKHPDRGPFFFFTRAGFSGRPGSVASENANFPGDETTDFDRASGLPSIIPDMLNRGLGGAYGFDTDIGGYEDVVSGAVTKELFVRWSEAAALMPVFRVHNSAGTGVKMPWAFDAETLAIWKSMAALHLKAKPLILKLWKDAQLAGLPVTRPLWLNNPNDPQALEQDEEFLLGDDVLVTPVVAQGASTRDSYFPVGCWQRQSVDAHPQGAAIVGPKTVNVSGQLGELPYYFRCGTQPF